MSKTPEQMNAALDELMVWCVKHGISYLNIPLQEGLDFKPEHPMVEGLLFDAESGKPDILQVALPALSAHEKMALLSEKKMTNESVRICPTSGVELHRDVRPTEISYGGRSETVMLPGWYPPHGCEVEGADSIHTGADLRESDEAFERLKAHERQK